MAVLAVPRVSLGEVMPKPNLRGGAQEGYKDTQERLERKKGEKIRINFVLSLTT